MRYAILYLENSDKAKFADLKKCSENDYVLNKSEYPRTVTAEQSLLLNYQPNYNSNRQSKSQCVSKTIMFSQLWGNEYDQGKTRHNKKEH